MGDGRVGYPCSVRSRTQQCSTFPLHPSGADSSPSSAPGRPADAASRERGVACAVHCKNEAEAHVSHNSQMSCNVTYLLSRNLLASIQNITYKKNRLTFASLFSWQRRVDVFQEDYGLSKLLPNTLEQRIA